MGAWSKHVMGNDMAMDFFGELTGKRSVKGIGRTITTGLNALSAFLDRESAVEVRDPESIEREVKEFMGEYRRVNTHLKLTAEDFLEKETNFRELLLNLVEETPENAIQTVMAASFIVAWGKSLVAWKPAEGALKREKLSQAIDTEGLVCLAESSLASMLQPEDQRVELFPTQEGQCRRLRRKLQSVSLSV